MKIRQTTFYALEVIRTIYLEDKEIVTSVTMAEKEGFSQGVLLRVLRVMANAGILRAHQGRGNSSGGFSLARDIDELTLFDIVDTMEKVDICENLDEKAKKKEIQLFSKCRQINDYLKEEFSRYTIRDLFDL